MKKLLIIVGTRPNFIKITQFSKVLEGHTGIEYRILHTGQHYDNKMSAVFLEKLDISVDYNLGVSESSPNTMIAEIMKGIEEVILNEYTPDLMIVVGDVNSTVAAALTANKMNIKLAHVESGLRSRDRSMPEEINRLITDELADYFFVTEQSGIDNLRSENKDMDKVFFVGNTMIDTLVKFSPEIDESKIVEELNITAKGYSLMTMHRPSNVDSEEGLHKLVSLIKSIAANTPLVFPIHPRTLARLSSFGMQNELKKISNVILTEPLDYFAFQNLIKNSSFVITDSGGIQEETTYYKVPCLTLRDNTERPSTIEIGSNVLVPFDIDVITEKIAGISSGNQASSEIPEKWDGEATVRIIEVIKTLP